MILAWEESHDIVSSLVSDSVILDRHLFWGVSVEKY